MAAAKRRGLGRGLDALIGSDLPTEEVAQEEKVKEEKKYKKKENKIKKQENRKETGTDIYLVGFVVYV